VDSGNPEILSADPGSVAEFEVFCRATGNELVESGKQGGVCKIIPPQEAACLPKSRASRQGCSRQFSENWFELAVQKGRGQSQVAKFREFAQRAGAMVCITGCSIPVDLWEYCLYPSSTTYAV